MTTVEGERKTVTALFADLKGSTELMRDLDPEVAQAIVDPALKIMVEAVRYYDGYVVQSTGDGIFALFGAPLAHEDHPQRSLYAALRMQNGLRGYAERLSVESKPAVVARVGVNSGEVVMRAVETGGRFECTPVGYVTNLAARIQTAAPAGGIAISAETRRLVEGYVELRALGLTELKGVAGPIEVYEVIGLGPLRTHFEVSTRRGLTTFVGRGRELAQMRNVMELASSGHGQVLAIVADAGAGKSRLVYEFKAQLHNGCKLLEAYSVSYGKASAWLPMLELLRNYFGIETADDAAARREKVRTALAALDPGLGDTLPFLLALLGIQEMPDPLAQMDPAIRRRRTRDAIKRIIVSESLVQPMVVIFEDLHWIDSETQAFLDVLADSIAGARLLLLVNYRPEYRHEWSGRSHYLELRLDPLAGEDAAALMEILLGNGSDLDALKRLIAERTGGNPFFIEEMVHGLLEEGALIRNGTIKLARRLSQVRLPVSVQSLLASRIDHLPPTERELLHTLAVLGREFPLGLVQRVTGRSIDELEPMLGRLRSGEFIYEQPAVDDLNYIFKHALTQEVAYNSLLVERRKILHERAAQSLETMFATQLDDHLSELAHHYSRSRNTSKAIEYLQRAGQQAAQRSAHAEVISHLTSALEVLKTLPDTLQRAQQELLLQTTLGSALIVTKGNAVAEVGAVYARAVELGRQLRDEAQLFPVLFGLRSFHLTRGELVLASAEAEQLVSLAERLQDSGLMVEAHLAHGNSLFSSEELIPALEHYERAAALYDPEKHRSHAYVYGLEPGVFCLGRIAWCLVLLGYPDRALQKVEESMALAQKQQHPFSLATALVMASLVYDLRGDRPALQQENAEAAIALCAEQGFANMLGHSTQRLGAALAMQGRVEEGIELMRKGVAAFGATGQGMFQPYLLLRRAEALLLAGRLQEGLAWWRRRRK